MTDTQTDFDFLPLRVIGKTADGKNRYDRAGKRKLIEACQRPGASVAGLALKAGVNTNQLRKWISLARKPAGSRYRRRARTGHAASFVPVLEVTDVGPAHQPHRLPMSDVSPPPMCREAIAASPHPPSRLVAQLPNGVSLELECGQHDTALLTAMIDALRGR
jgi:transposase